MKIKSPPRKLCIKSNMPEEVSTPQFYSKIRPIFHIIIAEDDPLQSRTLNMLIMASNFYKTKNIKIINTVNGKEVLIYIIYMFIGTRCI